MKSDRAPVERDAPARELGPLLTRIFRGGRTWFVGLTGPLDTVSVDGFRETITNLLGERCRSLVLDLRVEPEGGIGAMQLMVVAPRQQGPHHESDCFLCRGLCLFNDPPAQGDNRRALDRK